ncbi:hypothetical protein Plo01_28900 [Planobispora longispora]|uniref:Mini-circle protein n=2 Tax=Planobispora longispora TaxID=28887 RepID=A0A8J3RLR8_9ACTN|nr:hypothetical protein Plo01_28900 [Planobispora longispora]
MNDPLLAVAAASVDGERTVLETFLNFHRATIVRKVRGLSEEDARLRRVPSLTTPAGLVKHLTVMELRWFQRVLARRTEEELPPEGEEGWILDEHDTVESLIAEYERVCALSRETAAGFALDHTVPHPRLVRVSLRWIYVHLIEETARHAGHADILRELTDGSTGDVG